MNVQDIVTHSTIYMSTTNLFMIPLLNIRLQTCLQGEYCSCIFFFFSSRRRHTRLQGDWSSDVCSSDLGSRASVAHAISAGVDPRGGSPVRGQVLGAGKALDLADLQRHGGGQDHAHSRQGHQPLHRGRDLDQFLQPPLELQDLFAQGIQLSQHLPRRPAGLLGQPLDPLLQLRARALPVGIAVLAGRHPVLGQRRRQAVLPARPLRHQHHPRARQLTQLPQPPGRNPYRRQRAVALQPVQPVRVELVGLVDQSHHHLRLARMHQPWLEPRLLDLVHDPVPVRRRFQRHRRAPRAAGQRLPDRPWRVLQTILPHPPGAYLFVLHPGIVLVTIKGDIFFHARLLSSSRNLFHRQPTLTAGVALSYFHPERERRISFFPLAPFASPLSFVRGTLRIADVYVRSLFSRTTPDEHQQSISRTPDSSTIAHGSTSLAILSLSKDRPERQLREGLRYSAMAGG